jgi:acyl-CoA thioesterase-2
MGDIALETAVTALGGPDADSVQHFSAMVHADWEIWGPEGGYIAAIALRAAGAASPFARPASFYCQYLSVAAFEPVEITVTPRRSGRTVLAQRVEISQQGRPVLDAMVWSIGEVAGLVHDDGQPPDVPDPDELTALKDLLPPDEPARFEFWNNFEQRPVLFIENWPPEVSLPPIWRTWVRCTPTATFDDPWVDAARSLIVLDVMSWPSGSLPHAYLDPPFIAPSLDLYATFQHPGHDADWLLLDGHSPVADDGLLSWTGRVWTRQGRLLASGGGQAVFRHT